MTSKAIGGLTLGLGFVLSLHAAYADDAPQPTPTPAPALGDPAGDAPAPAPQKGEKADTTETLQKGGDVRPGAQGVSPADQKTALLAFREGNGLLNDGLFARAAETYKGALTHWKHPAIYYNLSLALMNLDQPVEAYESMENATKFGVFGDGTDQEQKWRIAFDCVTGLTGRAVADMIQPGVDAKW